MPAKTFHDPIRIRLVVSGQPDLSLQALLDRFRDLAIPLVSLHPVDAIVGAR